MVGRMATIPGGELSGSLETKHIDDWSFVEAPFVDLETNGDSLRSVQLNYILREGSFFIDPSEGKTWFTELKKNTNVRIRFDGKIYPVTATLVGKPVELAGLTLKDISIDSNQEVAKQTSTESLAVGIRLVQCHQRRTATSSMGQALGLKDKLTGSD